MKTVSEVIETRRTVHSYLSEEVPEEHIQDGLRMALMSPNHKMSKPWKFIQVKGQARTIVANVALKVKAKKEDLSEVKKEALRNKYQKEGSLVFFLSKKSSDAVLDRENYATISCAIQNYSLVMTDRGYGTKWSTGGIIRDPEIFSLLGVS